MQWPKVDKKLILLLAVVVAILCVSSFQYGRYLGGRTQQADQLLLGQAQLLAGSTAASADELDPEQQAEPEPEPEPQRIAVHVKGAVAEPGLYELAEGSRWSDALAAAGLLAEANTDLVNLAAVLTDGAEVIVPFREQGQETDWQALLDTSTAGQSSGDSSEPSSSSSSTYTGMVNINTDGLTRLQSLEGIGPVKAQAIIDYREANGPFTSIQQITKVKGIGSATYEKIKDRLSVE